MNYETIQIQKGITIALLQSAHDQLKSILTIKLQFPLTYDFDLPFLFNFMFYFPGNLPNMTLY